MSYIIFCLCLAFFVSALKGYVTSNSTILKRHRRAVLPTWEEAKLIVDKHNEFRSIIGDEGEEPMPANMRFMTWDEGLAHTSLRYAKRCIWKHSKFEERKTERFSHYNGENLWAGDGEHVTDFDPAYGITKWFMEYKDYTFENNSCVPGMKCGHYTQVVWAKSYKVGCGWLLCPNLITPSFTMENAMYMVCQYAPAGNVDGETLYKIGPRCSECNSFDTCPDNKLCRNEKRDILHSVSSNSGSTAGILSGVAIVLASGAGAGYYVYIYHKAKAMQMWNAVKKRRRVSSIAPLNECKSSSTNGINKEEEQEETRKQREAAEGESVNSNDNIINNNNNNDNCGARLSSVEIDAAATAP